MTQSERMGCWWLAVALAGLASAGAPEEKQAREILDATGVHGGLIVHLGCGDGRLTAALRANESCLVHGLDTDAARVEAARKQVQSLGLRGEVSVDAFDGRRLPYIGNLVNLLVAEDLGGVAMDEVMRVLAPGSVAYVRQGGAWAKTVKPWPKAIDEWTHYLHGPDNNAVAHDTVVGPPRHMQWVGSPVWARNHHRLCSISSVVTAKGRLFYIVDEATSANTGVPGKWSLVARDAFNGVLLWEKPMASWTWHQLRFRSGPPQVTRLLVASGDRVYAPLGLNEPVSEMDAATGKTLRAFDATAAAEEIVLANGVLLVLKGDPVAEQAAGHEKFQGVFKLPNRKAIVAVDAATGGALWTWSGPGAPLRPETLASDGRRACIQVGEGVACLDLRSGRPLWTSGGSEDALAPKGGKKKGGQGVTYGRYTLVMAEDVVLSDLAGQLTALSADTGKTLWACKAGGGFHSPLDIFVINGLVWQGLHTSDSVAPPPVNDFSEARDLLTGEVKRTNQVMVDLQTAGHHHRCYREKATDRYILTGKRGIELMDLVGDNHSRNNWVRGTCQYGIMPANGLLYAPSHACGCYMESLLKGFWALAAASEGRGMGVEGRVEDSSRLEKGPAYQVVGSRQTAVGSEEDWPQYRHDPLRSGITGTVVPAELAPAWATALGGSLTPPVVAGGKVLVASVDGGTVYALDQATGRVAWKYACGSRVDSPPAIHTDRVLFGSADGRVYCLRLGDGQLAWRFLAAPADMRTVAFDRVESLWPVHGSVLVLDGVAYCSAGRSTWLDGGIDLYGLDPATGKTVCRTHLESRQPVFREGKDKAKPNQVTKVAQNTTDYKTFLQPDLSDSFSMAGGATSDVLVSDGMSIFLRQVRFDTRLEKQDRMGRHLFSTSSLLDDAENHRSHWVLGTGDFSRVPVAYSWVVDNPGRWNPSIAVPTGVLMLYDDQAVWGVQRQGDANGRYSLFKRRNAPFSAGEQPLPDFRTVPKGQPGDGVWKHDLPVRARAMLRSGPRLYLAAAPVEIPADDPNAAYEGRRGGMLWVLSAEDGSKLAEQSLGAPAVWDGLAAADRRLYLSTVDGKVLCFGGRE